MSSLERHAQPAAPEPERFAIELPSDLGLIEQAVEYLESRLREFAYDGSRLTLNFRVGITEALANAMLYGNGSDASKHVRLDVSLDPECVSVLVADEGPGFDPGGVPDPTAPANRERSGGRGIFLLRRLMDEVQFNACGNAVRLVLYRDEPARPCGSLE
jgi:serine/threonine-protein kinase RsbW